MSSRKHRRSSFDDTQTSRPSCNAAKTLMEAVLSVCSGAVWKWKDHLELQEALLRRCLQMELFEKDTKFLRQLLLSGDRESGYTALHEAIYAKDLARILLILRYASDAEATRLNRRPMELLYGNGGSTLMKELASAKDNEGMTPAALLALLQRRNLSECRNFLERMKSQQCHEQRSGGAHLEIGHDYKNEFDPLSRDIDVGQLNDDDSAESPVRSSCDNNEKITYGCEVLTFGRAHHCALGVVASDKNHQDKEEKLRPNRVQAFAQDTVGKAGSAVAAAAAAYHTLVVTARGELFAFGLGKGFRLGTGNEKPCASPVRVGGPLLREKVVGVAAAENHSLCVTSSGHVFAFGSNGFGQLGMSSESSSTGYPRRIDDLKHVVCIAVAAGTKHSVFLSQNGEVFVCGDNSDGQLSFGKRSGRNCFYKVHRVEALWKAANGPRKAIAIAASEYSTMTLISGSGAKGLPVNSIYCWGHGNPIPSKVKFDSLHGSRPINPVAIASARYHNVIISSDGRVYSWGLHADSLGTVSGQNRYQPGSREKNELSSHSTLSDPQLVIGMLPENGGGFAVAVSASENHTAIITDTGALYTFGDTYKPNIMGHEGVRWQPEPKRVPGVHQAVGVSASKEHTVLLIATMFPKVPRRLTSMTSNSIPSLEENVGRTIAKHIDLFNAIPILVIAERTRTTCLLRYCREFIKMNLDGVLNVGQRSAMDCYLNEQLLDSSKVLHNPDELKDDVCHPFVKDVLFGGYLRTMQGQESFISDAERWLKACEHIVSQPVTAYLAERVCASSAHTVRRAREEERFRIRAASFSEEFRGSQTPEPNRRKVMCSPRCEELTKDMNFATVLLAETRLERLSKEVRSIRKRLNQISKLEHDRAGRSTQLTEEEIVKLARKSQLEADLLVYEPAIELIKEKIRVLRLSEGVKLDAKSGVDEAHGKIETVPSFAGDEKHGGTAINIDEIPSPCNSSFRCDTCQITCPDKKSFELHMSGRKHRNRLAHRADEEQKNAAALILVDQHRQSIFLKEQFHQPRGEGLATPKSSIAPWEKNLDNHESKMKPKFKLPPPPHEVAELVVDSTNSRKGFLSIAQKSPKRFAQEKAKQGVEDVVLSNFNGPVKCFREIMKEEEEKQKLRSSDGGQLYQAKPANASQIMKNLPRASFHPTPLSVSPYEAKAMHPSRSWAWSTPQKIDARPTTTFTLRDIQEQEMAFKVKEDRSISTNGSWFVQQRERAGSFKDIQYEAEQLSEEQRFIEEQIQIEKQIYEEIAARKLPEDRTSRDRKPRHNKNAKRRIQKSKTLQQTER